MVRPCLETKRRRKVEIQLGGKVACGRLASFLTTTQTNKQYHGKRECEIAIKLGWGVDL